MNKSHIAFALKVNVIYVDASSECNRIDDRIFYYLDDRYHEKVL